MSKHKKIILTNLDYLPGYKITSHYGLIVGSSVRTRHFGVHFISFFKNIFGGEIKGYSELLEHVRDESLERLCAKAQHVGANAVLNIRFSTSEIAKSAAEIMVYGTAVRVEKNG